MTTVDYPRDLKGYGAHPPRANWPGGARVALQFVINYEEGSENSVLHGDKASEAFLSEMIGADAREGVRHMSMESFYEYGSRVGVWRLFNLFKSRGIPVTIFGVAMAMERHPEVVEVRSLVDRNHSSLDDKPRDLAKATNSKCMFLSNAKVVQ